MSGLAAGNSARSVDCSGLPFEESDARSCSAASFDSSILTVNCGSSSLKFALFGCAADPRRLVSGAVTDVGAETSRTHAAESGGAVLWDAQEPCANHHAAIAAVLDRLEGFSRFGVVGMVGHRIVHGGPGCDCPEVVTPQLENRLRKLTPLAPLHLPANLDGVAAARLRLPHAVQVACFDTAFHETLPPIARRTGLPRDLEQGEIRRYGYHGLSYEFVVDHIRRTEGAGALDARMIVAHLGAGASMAAIRDGKSVDTTMGFSTAAGLPMATRSGDLDPGLVLYLLFEKKWAPEDLQTLVYQRSGLLGLSGQSGNMKTLTAPDADEDARAAVDFFCYQARKYIGGLAASLGGLDRLVFTGGVGAHSSLIREKICEPLSSLLSIRLDQDRNAANETTISSGMSLIPVEVIETDEELMIARHGAALGKETRAAGRARP